MDIVEKLVEIPREESVEIARAVAIAKETETDARDFYEKAAGKTGDAELKQAMEMLAKEEQEHFDVLSAVEEKLKEEGKFAVVKEEALQHLEKPKIYPEKGSEVKQFQDKSDIAALLWAMRAERKAQLFYEKQAEKSGVEEVKQFFNALAEFEDSHFQYLDGMVSTMTDTGDFILG